MAAPVVNSGGVDIWTDLLIACLVVFVVLAPAFFFRVPEDAEAAATSRASTPARASIYYHSRDSDSSAQAYRRRAEVQQRPSGSRVPDIASKSVTSSNKRAGLSPTCQKKAL
ncbi:hypothetical protein PF005_g7189 [Phytophthora fragariae]|uniref:Uncharacterized protein n=1 Tax=Phytophthora fragariae TaxID=53985 RepID=A0A6A3SSD9_9STRA|nr:hypothetical protein PF003_g39305 [Phytophthora fragariae]KAE8942344.1 hypothetical protein PF009_g7891 [Phytophthora fragariae]KAE9019829.1 hypothetical protein PF011_g5661 [Phytophthora fragariae]KAE9122672.1 hypothetical protein PF010_g6662 [Phytophthora fragariae]KAE9122759.1 hypothetical protein PF007_g7312 [Phytophthora fragariae]